MTRFAKECRKYGVPTDGDAMDCENVIVNAENATVQIIHCSYVISIKLTRRGKKITTYQEL